MFFIYLLIVLLGVPIYIVCWVIHNLWTSFKPNPLDDVQSFEENNLQRLLPFYFKAKELNAENNSHCVDIERKVQCSREIIALYDSLWAICAETKDGRAWFCATATEPCHQAQLALKEYSELLEQLEQFHHTFFPVESPDDKIQSDWEIIPCNHNSYEQLLRQKRSIKTAPIYIDHKVLSSYFLASTADTVYSVSLFSCDCPDFQKRGLPCKHMYRLFYELTVGTEMSSALSTPDVLATDFYKLPNCEKSDLIQLAQSLLFYPDVTKVVVKTPQIFHFVDLGLIQQRDRINDADYFILLDRMTKDEILISLHDYGIEDCRPSWSKKKVVDWVVTNHRDYLEQKFSYYMAITIPSALNLWYSGIVDAISFARSSNSDFIKNWDAVFDDFI